MLENIIEKINMAPLGNGVIFSFDKSTTRADALESILDLLNEFYPVVFDKNDYYTKYRKPKKVWIKENTKQRERSSPDIFSYILFADYKDTIPYDLRHKELHLLSQKKYNNVALGFFKMAFLETDYRLKCAVYLSMRNRALILGNFVKDDYSVQRESVEFFEYALSKLPIQLTHSS